MGRGEAVLLYSLAGGIAAALGLVAIGLISGSHLGGPLDWLLLIPAGAAPFIGGYLGYRRDEVGIGIAIAITVGSFAVSVVVFLVTAFIVVLIT